MLMVYIVLAAARQITRQNHGQNALLETGRILTRNYLHDHVLPKCPNRATSTGATAAEAGGGGGRLRRGDADGGAAARGGRGEVGVQFSSVTT